MSFPYPILEPTGHGSEERCYLISLLISWCIRCKINHLFFNSWQCNCPFKWRVTKKKNDIYFGIKKSCGRYYTSTTSGGTNLKEFTDLAEKVNEEQRKWYFSFDVEKLRHKCLFWRIKMVVFKLLFKTNLLTLQTVLIVWIHATDKLTCKF